MFCFVVVGFCFCFCFCFLLLVTVAALFLLFPPLRSVVTPCGRRDGIYLLTDFLCLFSVPVLNTFFSSYSWPTRPTCRAESSARPILIRESCWAQLRLPLNTVPTGSRPHFNLKDKCHKNEFGVQALSVLVHWGTRERVRQQVDVALQIHQRTLYTSKNCLCCEPSLLLSPYPVTSCKCHIHLHPTM